MMNSIFEKELSEFTEKHPNFSVKQGEKGNYAKGILDIKVDDIVVRSFSIEIHAIQGFPYRFPKVYEVGYDIPAEPDYHKYSDNSCCLTVEADEILQCRNKMTLIHFFEKIVIPYFAHQTYRLLAGKYISEYSHGIRGVFEFYVDFLKTSKMSVVKQCLRIAFGHDSYPRNSKCYCGSEKKYKKCHLDIEYQLNMIGKKQVLKDLKNILR